MTDSVALSESIREAYRTEVLALPSVETPDLIQRIIESGGLIEHARNAGYDFTNVIGADQFHRLPFVGSPNDGVQLPRLWESTDTGLRYGAIIVDNKAWVHPKTLESIVSSFNLTVLTLASSLADSQMMLSLFLESQHRLLSELYTEALFSIRFSSGTSRRKRIKHLARAKALLSSDYWWKILPASEVLTSVVIKLLRDAVKNSQE